MALIPGRTSAYRKRLNDPGRRSTIPDAYLKALSPALFARRQANQKAAYNDATLYNPTALLSGKSLRTAASTLAGLEIDPQIAAAQQDSKLTGANYAALQQRIGGYNKLMTDELGKAASTAISSRDSLAQQLAQTRTDTGTDIGATFDKSKDFLAEDTRLRGSGLNDATAQRLTTEFQQQRFSADQQQQANQAAGNIAGQGWAGLATLMQGVGAMRGADTLGQAATAGVNAQSKIQQQISGLQGQRGALTAKNTQDLRQSQFENQVTATTLGIKQQDANTAEAKATQDAKDKQADRSIKRQQVKDQEAWHGAQDQLRRDLASQAHGDKSDSLKERIRHDRSMEQAARARINATAKGKEKSKYTWLPDTAHAKQVGYFDQVKNFVAHNKGQGRAKNAQVLLNAKSIKELKAQYGDVSPAIISAALDAEYLGRLSSGTVKKLHDAGIRVDKLGIKTTKQLTHRPPKNRLYDTLPSK